MPDDSGYVLGSVPIPMSMDDKATAPWMRHYGTVYRFVRRASRLACEDAEDLTQEVFEAAVAALGEARLAADSQPLAWLYTVARRRLADRLRAARVASVPLDREFAAIEGNEHAYGPSIATALTEAVNSLHEDQRRVNVQKLFEGRSFAEIAQVVGANEEACRMRFSRGLGHVRRALSEKGVRP